ncbi:MAG: Glucitol operon repressor [Firmicutes bacterium ADurb.Bin182]|nr:MAG: Glucitol operon repressor [Firmicutes bacterium ADurb.Bin182]
MASERRTKIREYIQKHGEASIAELSSLCGGYSSMTLWRDLKKLEQEGFIRRTRGGAISVHRVQSGPEGLYSQRALSNTQAKSLIAKAALGFIKPSHSIYFDAGSTIMELVKILPDEHFTIITSGANIATELSQRSLFNVTLIGGQINSNTLSCSGPQAEAFLDAINIEIAVMATSGYSVSNGFTSGIFSEQQLKRKVIEKAKQVIMLMDNTKLDRSLPYTFADMQDIDVLICDSALPGSVQNEAEKCDVQVIVG